MQFVEILWFIICPGNKLVLFQSGKVILFRLHGSHVITTVILILSPNLKLYHPSFHLFSSNFLAIVYASKPEISFSVFKAGGSYHGNITCWSSRGSPPATFYLLLDDKEVGSVAASESLSAWFDVAIVLELDMGDARCRLETEVQNLHSEFVTLEVGEKCEQNARFLMSHKLWVWCFVSLSHSPCLSSPSWRKAGTGGGLSVLGWVQAGCCHAELPDQQRNVPSLLLALQQLCPSTWVPRGLSQSAQPFSVCLRWSNTNSHPHQIGPRGFWVLSLQGQRQLQSLRAVGAKCSCVGPSHR